MASVYIMLLSVLEYNNQYSNHLNILHILLLHEVYLWNNMQLLPSSVPHLISSSKNLEPLQVTVHK